MWSAVALVVVGVWLLVQALAGGLAVRLRLWVTRPAGRVAVGTARRPRGGGS